MRDTENLYWIIEWRYNDWKIDQVTYESLMLSNALIHLQEKYSSLFNITNFAFQWEFFPIALDKIYVDGNEVNSYEPLFEWQQYVFATEKFNEMYNYLFNSMLYNVEGLTYLNRECWNDWIIDMKYVRNYFSNYFN